MVAQQGIYAVDTILDRRVGARYLEGSSVAVWVTAKEILHDLPVGAGGRGFVLYARSVTIDVDVQWPAGQFLGTAEKFFASGQRIGVGQNHLIKDMNPTTVGLRQH